MPVPVFDAATAAHSSASAALTWSHTASGTDRYVKVQTTNRTTAGSVSGVTYGGVAMTQVGATQHVGTTDHKVWELVNPPTGAQSIVVTASGRATFEGSGSQ